MRHTNVNKSLTCLVLALGLSLLPGLLGAQMLLLRGSVNGVPASNAASPDGSRTIYFQGHTTAGIATLDSSQSTYDAVAWVPRWDPVPNGWAQGVGGELTQCQAGLGDYGATIIRVPLPWGAIVSSSWGTYCNGLMDPDILTMFHYVGQPNGLVYEAPPPVKFKNPGDGHTCVADPCDTKTGLYYQHDTDIVVPDVMPIKLTRTDRTEDTASRVSASAQVIPTSNTCCAMISARWRT